MTKAFVPTWGLTHKEEDGRPAIGKILYASDPYKVSRRELLVEGTHVVIWEQVLIADKRPKKRFYMVETEESGKNLKGDTGFWYTNLANFEAKEDGAKAIAFLEKYVADKRAELVVQSAEEVEKGRQIAAQAEIDKAKAEEAEEERLMAELEAEEQAKQPDPEPVMAKEVRQAGKGKSGKGK